MLPTRPNCGAAKALATTQIDQCSPLAIYAAHEQRFNPNNPARPMRDTLDILIELFPAILLAAGVMLALAFRRGRRWP